MHTFIVGLICGVYLRETLILMIDVFVCKNSKILDPSNIHPQQLQTTQ